MTAAPLEDVPDIEYRHVGPKHWVCRADLHEPAKAFFAGMLDPCKHAVAAYEEGEIVGWLRYELGRGGHTLYAAGTWVEPRYRDWGVAHGLWGLAMTRHKTVRKVAVRTVSIGGRVLVSSLVRWFPKHSFEVLT